MFGPSCVEPGNCWIFMEEFVMPSFFSATTVVGLLFLLAQNSESELGPPSNAVPSKQAPANSAVDPDFQPPDKALDPAATAQGKSPNSTDQELRKPFVDVDARRQEAARQEAARQEAARQESLVPPVNAVPSAATPTQAQDDSQHRYTKRWPWKRRFGSRSRSRWYWRR